MYVGMSAHIGHAGTAEYAALHGATAQLHLGIAAQVAQVATAVNVTADGLRHGGRYAQ